MSASGSSADRVTVTGVTYQPSWPSGSPGAVVADTVGTWTPGPALKCNPLTFTSAPGNTRYSSVLPSLGVRSTVTSVQFATAGFRTIEPSLPWPDESTSVAPPASSKS
jgi:hypothetical protein